MQVFLDLLLIFSLCGLVSIIIGVIGYSLWPVPLDFTPGKLPEGVVDKWLEKKFPNYTKKLK